MAQDKREQWERLNNQYSVIQMALQTLYRSEEQAYENGGRPTFDEVLDRSALETIGSDLREKKDKLMESLVNDRVGELKESYGLSDE